MRLLLLLIILCSGFLANAQEKYTVYFETGKDVPSEAHLKELEDWLKANSIEVIKVSGYTESIRNESQNQKLSDRRVQFVTELIRKYNRLSDAVEIRSFGESVSSSGNNQEDRKVEIWYNIQTPEASSPQPVAAVALKTELSKRIETSKIGDVLEIKNLNFRDSSDIILQESKKSLEDLLQIMKNMPTLKIDIQGHICCQRHDTHKIALSRAKAVYDYLISNGINKERVTYQSFGGTRPIYKIPEFSEAQQQANRRVEIQIMDF